jgi:hypothetical protein
MNLSCKREVFYVYTLRRGIFERSNVIEAAHRAPASIILRCASDGRSAHHLRALALRLPFGTILKLLTFRTFERFFCACIIRRAYLNGSNVIEAAQRAPAPIILRCAPDGRSARHLRAVALRLPFGTILENEPFEHSRGFLCLYHSEGIFELLANSNVIEAAQRAPAPKKEELGGSS